MIVAVVGRFSWFGAMDQGFVFFRSRGEKKKIHPLIDPPTAYNGFPGEWEKKN